MEGGGGDVGAPDRVLSAQVQCVDRAPASELLLIRGCRLLHHVLPPHLHCNHETQRCWPDEGRATPLVLNASVWHLCAIDRWDQRQQRLLLDCTQWSRHLSTSAFFLVGCVASVFAAALYVHLHFRHQETKKKRR